SLIPGIPISFAEEDDFGGFGLEEEGQEINLKTQWQLDFVHSGFFEVIYVSEDNFKYGQYNGLNDEGPRFSGEFDFISRPGQQNSSETFFWTMRGHDVGLKTGSLEYVFGNQGSYEFTISFDNFVRTGNNTGTTPFYGQGSSVLFLPSGWTADSVTSGMSLSYDPLRVEQEVERNQFLMKFTKQFSSAWAFTAAYEMERKSGEKIMGAAIYFDAANPHAVLLPVPVDYENHQFSMNLDYTTRKLQMQLTLLNSELDNRYDELIWQNPYGGAFGTYVDYPTGPGSLDLPSDTSFQQISFKGNYQFSPKVKLRVDASQGKSEVDDTLSAYTINEFLVVNEAPPINEIDDSLDTSHFYVSLLTSPWKKMTVNAKYRFEARENNLPVMRWNYVRGDGYDQFDPMKSTYNQPHRTEKDEYTLEGTLRFGGGSRLTVGYDFNKVWRTFSSVDETEEDVYRIEYKTRFFDKLTARIEYNWADLGASEYNWEQSYYNTYTIEQINLIPDNQRFNNHPMLRQYHLANHEYQTVKASLDLPVNEKWNLSMDINYVTRDYDETELGLKSIDQQQLNFHAQYTPAKDLAVYFWLTWDNNEMDQTGRAFRGGVEKPANDIYPPYPEGSDPARNWDLTETGDAVSLGFGFEWELIPNKLDISTDYSFVKTTIEDRFTVYGAWDLAGENMPDITSDMHHLEFTGSYHFSSSFSLKFRYEYYRYVSEDWAMDGVSMSTMDKVLSLGMTSPDEVINVISATALYRF
ncbi:MAG: MtrB/PioB family decaheme-associated outer membrane protein, partial [Gammaproteobacteria bacterium]|nr:MtrB/PioB family decaheme-associated outer membrane protein [Gammaproteobacteria bacterium]